MLDGQPTGGDAAWLEQLLDTAETLDLAAQTGLVVKVQDS